MLLKLLRESVQGLSDKNDKVQWNMGRTLGNLLQLLDEQLLRQTQIQKVAGQAIEALVKACGASGNNAKVLIDWGKSDAYFMPWSD